MGSDSEYSQPVDKDVALECAKACAIFDLTEKYTQEGEFLAGMSREDAEAIVTTMVADIDIQKAMQNGCADASDPSFQGNSGSPFSTFSAEPTPPRKGRIVISREKFLGWLKAGALGAETAQEHGTLTEITEEEEAAILAQMKNHGDDESPIPSLQEWTSPDPMLPFIPAELRTSQSAQLIINEPSRDVKGKRRASPEPEEPDYIVTCTKRQRHWAAQPGEGSSKDGEPLTELLAKNAPPKLTEGDGLLWDIARIDPEKPQEQDKTVCEQERRAEVIGGFGGGVS